MFPLNAVPVPGNTKFQVFYAQGTDRWQTWQKPAGCSMVYIFALGAGGGGGRPADGATTVGGGGGGSGSAARVLIPAILLPDTLYLTVPVGGAGATSPNSAGGSGGNLGVYVAADFVAASRIMSLPGAGGGQASTTGGTAGAVANANNNGAFGSLGLWYTIAGVAGSNGAAAANSNGSTQTFGTNGIITNGGGGGGNGTNRGGNVGTYGPPIGTGAALTGIASDPGFQKGLMIQPGLKTYPLMFSGGAGGSGNSTGTAGRGGDASYGGGGGGGGGCSGAGTSGNGGNGGDGFVIIGAF